MTQKERFVWLRSVLRRAWLRDPERAAALQLARRIYQGDNKRQRWEYSCAECAQWFMQKDVQVDHIIPAGTFLKPEDWATFGPGLFCDRSGLQLLCKTCHKIKTNKERGKC